MSQTTTRTTARRVVNPPRHDAVATFLIRLSDELGSMGGTADILGCWYDQGAARLCVTIVDEGAASRVAEVLGLAGPVVHAAEDAGGVRRSFRSWVGRYGLLAVEVQSGVAVAVPVAAGVALVLPARGDL